MTSERTMKGLRKIAAPFVVPAPKGCSTRTRLHLSADEEAMLWDVGTMLGSLERKTLADRVAALGEPGPQWRQRVKQALTPASSSRWGGSITGAVKDQIRLSRDAQYRHRDSLRTRVNTITERLAAPRPKPAGVNPDTGKRWGKTDPATGRAWAYYADETPGKRQRLDVLTTRLAAIEADIAAGQLHIVKGGKALWDARPDANSSEYPAWLIRWKSARLFLTADGDKDQKHGNGLVKIDPETGRLRLTIPNSLRPKYGNHFTLTQPVRFAHRAAEWEAQVLGKRAVSYRIWHDPDRGRWYVDASWTTDEVTPPTITELADAPVLAVDINAGTHAGRQGHLAWAVIDPHGNVIGTPDTLTLDLAGSTDRRDAQVRHAITNLIHIAGTHGCKALVIEDLNFGDTRAIGREGDDRRPRRGKRGKTSRRLTSQMPTAIFRDRLLAMTATAGLWVIAVDPAYTSVWGKQHWLPALTQTSETASGHHAAAVVIGRRAIGYRARRKPARPRTRQRTRTGTTAGQSGVGLRSTKPATAPPRATKAAGARTKNAGKRRQDRSVGKVKPESTKDSLTLTS